MLKVPCTICICMCLTDFHQSMMDCLNTPIVCLPGTVNGKTLTSFKQQTDAVVISYTNYTTLLKVRATLVIVGALFESSTEAYTNVKEHCFYLVQIMCINFFSGYLHPMDVYSCGSFLNIHVIYAVRL